MARYYADVMSKEAGIKSEDYLVYGQDTLLHIFNFNGGGFVMISSDKRTEPILIKSDEGEMILEDIDSRGIQLWIEDAAYRLHKVRGTDIVPEDLNTYRLWNNIEQLLCKCSSV